MIVGFGVFVLALLKKSEDLKRGGLAIFFVIALLSLPTYMTGYSAQKSVKRMPGVSQDVIDLHQRSALMALIVMEATGVVAWYGLWYSRRRTSSGARNTAAVLAVPDETFRRDRHNPYHATMPVASMKINAKSADR